MKKIMICALAVIACNAHADRSDDNAILNSHFTTPDEQGQYICSGNLMLLKNGMIVNQKNVSGVTIVDKGLTYSVQHAKIKYTVSNPLMTAGRYKSGNTYATDNGNITEFIRSKDDLDTNRLFTYWRVSDWSTPGEEIRLNIWSSDCKKVG